MPIEVHAGAVLIFIGIFPECSFAHVMHEILLFMMYSLN